MGNTQKVIDLIHRKHQLKAELDRVDAELSRIAILCKDRGITAVRTNQPFGLKVCGHTYAQYSGKSSGGKALKELGIHSFVRQGYSYNGRALGDYLIQQGYEVGDSFELDNNLGRFTVKQRGWFVKKIDRQRKRGKRK